MIDKAVTVLMSGAVQAFAHRDGQREGRCKCFATPIESLMVTHYNRYFFMIGIANAGVNGIVLGPELHRDL